jgi:hypothetical protein
MFIKGQEKTQAGIAAIVYGDRRKQGQVSRDLKKVEAWLKAGNILPDLEGSKPKTYSTDPRNLDKGPPPSGRGKHKQQNYAHHKD